MNTRISRLSESENKLYGIPSRTRPLETRKISQSSTPPLQFWPVGKRRLRLQVTATPPSSSFSDAICHGGLRRRFSLPEPATLLSLSLLLLLRATNVSPTFPLPSSWWIWAQICNFRTGSGRRCQRRVFRRHWLRRISAVSTSKLSRRARWLFCFGCLG
jgi:hypothetical protein